MSWYETRIFNPFILEKSLDVEEIRAERRALLEPAAGEILEIGLGTGLNLPCYPASVRAISAVGPEPSIDERAAKRASERGLRIDHVSGDARSLPFDAGRFDVAVCCLVLCTIPEPERAVRELSRVLKPNGKLLFFEHVAAKSGARRSFQRLLNGVMRPMLCGCEVTRDSERTIRDNGFELVDIARYDLGALAWSHRSVIRGVARPAS